MKKRIIYIDLIKIIAMLGPILIHVTSQVYNDCSVYSNRFFALSMFNSLGRCGVNLFVMCTGVLLLGNKELTKRKIFSKYIPRFLLSFIIFNFIYSLVYNNFDFTYTFINWYKKINSSHLWYLIMIMVLYMMIPILNIFINNAKGNDIKYFLILAFIFQSCIFFIQKIEILSWISRYYNHFNLPVVSGYVGYLILGYYLNKYEISNKTKKSIILIGLISLMVLVFGNIVYSRYIGTANNFFSHNFTPFVVFYSMSIFIIVKDLYAKFKNKINSKQFIIAKISNCTFGIYLIHMLIIKGLNYYNLTALNYNAFIFVPIASLIVYIVSMLGVMMLKRIPILKEFIT